MPWYDKFLKNRPKVKPAPKPKKSLKEKGSDFGSGRRRWTPSAWRSFRRRYRKSHVGRVQPRTRPVKGNIDDLLALFDRLRRSFIAKRDKREKWDTHLEAVLKNLPWRDDCDGFVSTSLDVVLHFAYTHPQACAFHRINSGRNKIKKTKATHGVATVDMDGTTWVFDNLKDHLYKMTECPKEYTWLTHMRLDKPGKWYSTEF